MAKFNIKVEIDGQDVPALVDVLNQGQSADKRGLVARIKDQLLSQFTGGTVTATAAAPAKRGGHYISPEGRARIAAAQKRRWAKLRSGK